MSGRSHRPRILTNWALARLNAPRQTPSAQDWIPAKVPGAVQIDWARAHGLPDYNYGQNVRAYDGLEDSHWLYRTSIPQVTRQPGERLFLVCDSVDFECEIRIGGAPVLYHRGMQIPFEYEVSAHAPGTMVEILLFPAPKRHAGPADRTQASHVTKPAMSYGWDWHPRLIPLGLCGETGFEVRPAAAIREVNFRYALAEDFSSADLSVEVVTDPPDRRYSWHLVDASGKTVLEGIGPRARLENPRLWWTHDHGEQYLYTLVVELPGDEPFRRRVGFRRSRLVMYPGAWDDPMGFPKSRNNPPVTFELNGRRIFAKGSNWVAPDIFPGLINADTYRPLLQLARGANFNILRNWGGAGAPTEDFFGQCDELGLLVWQEFPLACNLYPDDPDYLALLDAESKALIRRVRQHPCLALWVGGNELFNSWSRMTDQSLPLRLLNRNCYDLDPSTPFLPTSPVDGMGHGDYRFLSDGQDIFATFQKARNTAYSEFGCPSASPVDYLKAFIPADELWPPRAGTSWETHHGLAAWDPPDPTTWLCLGALETLFGPMRSLEDAVEKSTWLQSEGYKSVFEEARRQQPRCAMALNWCFNEPWPTAANNSLVNWPARPKPALASVAQACRPVLASARIPRFQWRAGEQFTAELWLLNDRAVSQPAGILAAELILGARVIPLREWSYTEVPAQGALAGPKVTVVLPDTDADEFTLRLTAERQPGWSSTYRLSLRR
ncbi:MAG: hypothetical protein HYV95_05370 [Opitutae bacterium]|nr:hypothetical protein [Opitutae bacterium]